MAVLPLYGKNPLKAFVSETNEPISFELGIQHWGLRFYKVYTNHDPWLALTFLRRGEICSLMLLYEKSTRFDGMKVFELNVGTKSFDGIFTTD